MGHLHQYSHSRAKERFVWSSTWSSNINQPATIIGNNQ
jgi:hypothetical protein